MTFGVIIKNPLKVRTHGISRNPGHKDLNALCSDKRSPIYQMTKDKVMYKHIRHGNASDKTLKRDAEQLQRKHHAMRKEESRRPALEKIQKLKDQYKKRYKQDTSHFDLRNK